MQYTFLELMKMAKSLIDRIPTSTDEQIRNGWKMFVIAYLNTTMTELERESAGPALMRTMYRFVDTSLETN